MKSSFFTRFIAIILLLLGVGNSVWGTTVTYTISSKNTLSTTGTAPSGSSASIVESYGTSKQMTSGNSQTLTLNGYNGYKITQIVLSMKSNKSSGAGKLSYSTNAGTSYTYIVGSSGSGVAFNNASWYGSWSQNYVNVAQSVDITDPSSDLIIKIEATANSLYCQSYEITYEAVGGGSTPTVSLNKSSTSIVAGSTETLTATTTNPSGAAVTWTTSKSSVATVSGGTVTAVAPGTATITAALSSNSSIKATCDVTVTAIPRTILIDDSDMDLTVGGATQTRTGALLAGTGTIAYESDDDDVATVDADGTVHPVGEGSCTITASVPAVGNYASASASYSVHVTDPNKGTINFDKDHSGNGYLKITGPSVSGNDTAGNTWSVTTTGTNPYFGANTGYYQVGSKNNPATSITFTMSLSQNVNFKTFKAMFGGTGDTNASYTMKVDDNVVKTFTITSSNKTATEYSMSSPVSGRTLTIVVTGSKVIANCYYISYTLETGTVPTFTPSSISAQNLVVGETYQTSAISVNSGGALSAESADEDVATVSWNNSTKKATVTAVAEGETTIKIKSTANGNYLAGELPFMVNVVAPTISLNKNSTTLEIVGTEVLTATVTNAGGATINWSTSDGTKVSLSGSGNTRTITGVAAGSSTITASITVNGYTYNATCSVTVNAPAADGYYIKVTSAPADWTGTYLIVYEDGSLAMNGGLTTLDATSNSINVTISDNKIVANAANDAASFNISSDDDGGWAILSRSGKYIGQTANSNGLRTSDEIIPNGLSLDGSYNAVISGSSTSLRYNNAVNQNRFRYYTSGQQPVALYKRQVALKSSTVISFGDTEKILAIGQHWTNAIETNNMSGAKTYSSSNSSIASVDSETGEITAIAAGGPVTITVNIAETSTHAAGSASFTVTVVSSNVRYYRPVTNIIELDAGIAAGKRFILATPYNGTYYAMGAINASNWAASVAVPTEEREVTYLKVNADLTGSVNEFTLTKHPNEEYSFRQSLDDTYPYLSHTYIDESTHKIYSSATNTDDNQKFYLNYINGAWAIVNKGTPNWYLQYNKTNPRFCCYINSQINPMIFMEGLAVASIGDDFAPDGVWTGEDGALSVTVTPVVGYSSEDYSVTWIASNTNITIKDEETGTFTGETAGELDVTILVRPTTATTYSPIAKSFPMIVTGNITDRMVTLFHESFGDNPNDARDWDDSYSVKSGVEYVYSGVEGYTIVNAKQNIDSEGFKLSGLNQSTQGTDASIIIGPLNVSGYTNLKVDYQWKAGSVKGTYSTSLSYSTTGASGSFTEVTGTGTGTVGFTNRSYDLPNAAQVSTLYLKIAFNTSNTRAIIDEVNLSGFASTYGFKVYEGSSSYSMLLVPKISPEFPKLNNNAIAVVDGLTDGQKTAMPAAILNAPNVVVNGNAYHLKVQDKVDGAYSPFYAPELLTTASKVSYARTAKEWNSLCLPFSLPFGKVTALFGDGAEIYQLTAVDANCQVVFTKFESGTIAAGTPVLVKSVSTSWNATELAGPFNIKGDAPVTFTPVGNSTVGTAELLGSYKEIVPGTVDGSQLYKLMTTASGQCFGKLSSTGKVYPFRIYLKYTPPTAQSAPANLPVKIHVIEGTIGDLNKDKMATLSDLTRMINMVNGVEEKANAADLDGDGDVNGVDVNRLAKILTKSK